MICFCKSSYQYKLSFYAGFLFPNTINSVLERAFTELYQRPNKKLPPTCEFTLFAIYILLVSSNPPCRCFPIVEFNSSTCLIPSSCPGKNRHP